MNLHIHHSKNDVAPYAPIRFLLVAEDDVVKDRPADTQVHGNFRIQLGTLGTQADLLTSLGVLGQESGFEGFHFHLVLLL
jgi:hypothetical protein